ncbi:hydrophobic surface binding protein A-domain-containing protein [Xylariomycetidae sp. FL2044]|nr:hydrophobic surface binding protein A-domain-containing protein [Xylariomycetidae sp. FL2044]
MKTSTVLSAISLAFSAAAEPLPRDLPSKVERDVATISSVAAEISNAITQLDTSVKAFSGDATTLQADAANLVGVIKSGASSIAQSGDIEIADALGLQPSITQLKTAGQALITDLGAKKDAFEAADLCSTVETTVKDLSSSAQSLVEGVIKKLPENFQSVAEDMVSGLTDAFNKGTAAFAADQCSGSGAGSASASASAPIVGSPSSAAAAVSTSAAAVVTGATTITVTAPCSTSAPAVTPSFPVGNTTVPTGTGAASPSATSPIVTAAAVANGVGSVGVMAGLAAALFL